MSLADMAVELTLAAHGAQLGFGLLEQWQAREPDDAKRVWIAESRANIDALAQAAALIRALIPHEDLVLGLASEG